MGGCRCTYRNCSVKSDGKTHMFHYPVFEKIRCHQWLINAQRLDFLNLKVSQLKNRCVCQHHFKEDNFMNYKKDKLIFDAIPTENGPFCDPSKFLGLEDSKEFPNLILLEDIENDFDFNDKKSNFSLKYGDFLTNSEFMDSSARYNRNNINLTKDNSIINLNSTIYTDNKKTLHEPQTTRLLPMKIIKKVKSQPMMAVPPYSDLSNENKTVKELNLQQNIIEPHTNFKIQDKIDISGSICLVPSLKTPIITPESNNQVLVKSEPRVRILSEKKIKGPITITGKFEKVSPTVMLNLPERTNFSQHMTTNVEEEPIIVPNVVQMKTNDKPSDKLKVLEVLDVEFDPVPILIDPDLTQKDENNTSTDQLDKVVSQSQPKKCTPIKNKVTPERSAAIEKKRKFNMRLKDIIESCLDKLEDPVKNYEISSITTNPAEKPKTVNKLDFQPSEKLSNTKQVSSHLAKDSTLPNNVQDYTIAYLEDRMKKMESTLLNKIEQNSQKIMDFKNTWNEDSCKVMKKVKELSDKKCASTQTNANEHYYKKFLYQEISKYLSPGANSTIYEELFINKYSCDQVKSPLKRKRRRCV